MAYTGYKFETLAQIMQQFDLATANYISCSHWGLFKHDYSLDFD
jgi:hypothetical protein